MEEKLIDVFKRVFNVQTLDKSISQMNFEQWDSINHISLIVEIESEFNVSFTPEEIVDMKSFAKIVLYLDNR